MSDIQFQCQICSADFREGVLNENGKCPTCEKEYPTVKTRQEAMMLGKPELHLNKKLTEEDVRKIIRDELKKIAEEKKAAGLEKARQIKEQKAKQETK